MTLMILRKAFENIVEKGEIAGNQHFLLFPNCLLPCKGQILSFGQSLSLYHTIMTFNNPRNKSF